MLTLLFLHSYGESYLWCFYNGGPGYPDQDNGRFNGGIYRRKRNMTEVVKAKNEINEVQIKPAPANDAAVAAAQEAFKIGDEIRENGVVTSTYAGLTGDGKQQIFAMPVDLHARGIFNDDSCMTFNKAVKTVKKLNSHKALGHNDWQIPDVDNLRVLQKNQNEGSLKGTFKKGAGRPGTVYYPNTYWSSTQGHDYPSQVVSVCFSDSYGVWDDKDDHRLSCRPVRLVPVGPT
jgi:hypothetical protein